MIMQFNRLPSNRLHKVKISSYRSFGKGIPVILKIINININFMTDIILMMLHSYK